MKLKLVGVVMIAGFLSGCQTFGGGTKPNVPNPPVPQPTVPKGNISGGGLVGGAFGIALSPADKQKGLDAEYRALEYGKGGELTEWAGSTPQVTGKVRAAQPYRVGSQDCRQYSHELVVAGAVTNAKATACRNNDGTWTLLE